MTVGRSGSGVQQLVMVHPFAPVNAAQIRDLLFRCGAVHYATVKMEIYRQTAADILSRMEIDGVNVKPLKVFLQ